MIVGRDFFILICLVAWAMASPGLRAQAAADDPLRSFMWGEMHKHLLGGEPYRFDERVRVIAPGDAEDSMNVPVLVDASALSGVKKILVFAELNPIHKVLEMEPKQAVPRIGFRIKVQQATPVRAAVLTDEGVWHVGGRIVDAAGGGCTAPSIGSANADWASRLGEVSGRLWRGDGSARLRLRVMHPMDTGLVAGIPAFYIEELKVHDADRNLLTEIRLYEPVSENPLLTIDLPDVDRLAVSGRDNNGNPVVARVLSGERGGLK